MFGTGVYTVDRKGREGARHLEEGAGVERKERARVEACAQGEVRVEDRVGKRLLAARATGAAFGADPRGVATPPVVMLRVP